MTVPAERVCLRCGYSAAGNAAFCRRCGMPFGAAPPVEAQGAPDECPVCYARADRRGLYPAPGGGRTSYERHAYDHELRPVGDDEWLEAQRDGDEVAIGRWRAPFDLTRRYAVTGQWDGGPNRTFVHNALVMAMVGASREGPDVTPAPPPPRARRSFRLPHRKATQPAVADADPRAPTDAELADARRAVDAFRERYLRGSRR